MTAPIATAPVEGTPRHTIPVAQCRFWETNCEITLLDPTFDTRQTATLFAATIVQTEKDRQAALASFILKTQANPNLPSPQNEISLLVTSNSPLGSLLQLPNTKCKVSAFTIEGETTVANACREVFVQQFVLHTHAGNA